MSRALLTFLLLATVSGLQAEPTERGTVEADSYEDQIEQGHVANRFEEWIEGAAFSKAYLFNCEAGEGPLFADGKWHPGVLPNYTKKLSKAQHERLQNALVGIHRKYLGALCYNPHHGFVFYSEQGKYLGHIELCFMCSTSRRYPEHGLSRHWDLIELKKIVTGLGMPTHSHPSIWRKFFAGEAIEKPKP